MALTDGLGGLMKQAQEMQERVKKLQDELAGAEHTGAAGGGMVRVTMTGQHDVRRVEIDPDLMTEDKELLEDLLAAAVNDAVRKVEHSQKDKMSALGAGMLPPGFKFPFQ